MMIRILVSDDEVFSINPAEFRFREACQFYLLFKSHYGSAVGQKGQRFLWTCYADAFLMAIGSMKDLTGRRRQLNASDDYRFMIVMRNMTVHKLVAASPADTGIVSRDISVSVGVREPVTPDYEEPVLTASKVANSLATYERELRAEVLKTDRKTGRIRTRFDNERENIEAALRWNAMLAAQANPRVLVADVFSRGLHFVANTCGYTMSTLM